MIHISDVIIIISSYLVGALPTGYFFSYLVAGLDITKHGSGNPGATNVARSLGTHYFFLIFFIDAGKACATLYAVQWLSGADWLCVASAASLLVGNSFSLFLRGGGGKGVATSFGCLAFFLPWYVVVVAMCCWVIIGWLTSHAFCASLGTYFLLFVGSFVYTGGCVHTWFLALLWGWLVMRHYRNLASFFSK